MQDASTKDEIVVPFPPLTRRLGRPLGVKDRQPRKPRGQSFKLEPDPACEPDDDIDEEAAWAERGQYWEGTGEQVQDTSRIVTKRRVEREPLVLNGHGVRLRVHQGSLVVLNGFTHYPQSRQELRFFPGDRKLPSRIVMLDSDGSLSLDVISWLSEQGIPLVVLDWRGNLVSVLGQGSAYNGELRKAQLEAVTSGVGLHTAVELIQDKIVACKETLQSLLRSPGQEKALERLDAVLVELRTAPPVTIDALRLLEARAAAAYFSCWQLVSLYWKGTGKKPIPTEWRQVGLRQSLLSGGNRNATHPVNAILNYAYGVLESQVRIATVSAGLDPTIGYLHTCRPGRPALVYDLMEPLRPQVDRLVLDFLRSHTLAAGDIILTSRGVCKLHPQLARRVTGLTAGEEAVRAVVEDVSSGLTGPERS